MRIFNITISLIYGVSLMGCGMHRADQDDVISRDRDAVYSIINVDQVGYLPHGPKYFVVDGSGKGAPADTFVIKKADGSGETLFTGALQNITAWDGDRVALKAGVFDQFALEGDFTLGVAGVAQPSLIHIGPHPYREVLRAALRFFYYQRASMDLDPLFAGIHSRKAGHPDDTCQLHGSTGKKGARNVAGGWYDAGDYGKYVVNGGISVATLMELYTIYPDLVKDDLAIPESGDGKSDLLGEAKVELDWMKRMQDEEDGGVFSKVAGLAWPEMISPDQDRQRRYVFGKATNSTLNFVAVMAQAARVYRTYDAVYAKDCLERAERAFEWARSHPDQHPPYASQGSGNYDGSNYAREFFWATTELYISTAKAIYLDYLTGKKVISSRIGIVDFLVNARIDGPADWGMGAWPTTGVTNLAYFSLLTENNALDAGYLQKIRGELIGYADRVLAHIAQNPYRVPLSRQEFAWGSNSIAANKGVVLGYAYHLTGNKAYLTGIGEIVHYVLGRNATGYSFVTGFGSRPSRFPHHRISAGDAAHPAIPGMLVGGPNAGRNDGLSYPSSQPEKIYLDDVRSYASNEVAINWNAPLAFLLGFLTNDLPEEGGG